VKGAMQTNLSLRESSKSNSLDERPAVSLDSVRELPPKA
jgi:hypothetical protein